MDTGSQTIEAQTDTGVVETNTGGIEFSGQVPVRDPMAPAPSDKPRPDHIPEKFWDAVKGEVRLDEMAKSYAELEKKFSAPKDEVEETTEETEESTEEKPEGETEETTEETEETTEETEEASEAPTFDKAAADAAAVYAETGELSVEAREPLKALGVTDEQIDFYIEGVKAKEAALAHAATEAAGSAEELQAAMAWAAENWPEKKSRAFNAQMGDVDTVKLAVPGLMADFRKANPGEGRLTSINTGINRGDVYGSMEEFQQELRKADEARDQVARKKAVAKLDRSMKAGTVKGSSPRRFR